MTAARPLAVALVHFPVLDREGHTITTAITNLDVHDISRSVRAFGARAFYVVHPIEAQRELVARVRAHWVDGAGARRIPDRREALALVDVVPSLEDAIASLHETTGEAPEVWTTAARGRATNVSYASAREALAAPGRPVLLLFGTGWGLCDEVLARADATLAPIRGVDAWNHLSVRAACAISLDRLLGPGW